MAQHVFITYTDALKHVADKIGNRVFFNSSMLISNPNISSGELFKMACMSTTEFFYVINSDTDIVFDNFDFTFRPAHWERDLVHIWNNDTKVRLYSKEHVIENVELYADTEISRGNVELKILNDKIFGSPAADIIFISYDEELANTNYHNLTARFPHAIRSHGVKGISEAHKAAAQMSTTDMIYVVDADAEILPTFDFTYYPNGHDSNSAHVWYSLNPVNDLVYGYGGVKLFPRKLLLEYTGSPIDFTTSVSKHFKVMPHTSNVTRFNTDPFSAWRSGFRECVKLASKLIHNQDNTESEQRLLAWCTLGADREFGEFTIQGANEGMHYGLAHKDQPDMLGLINDYKWLEKKFQG